MSSRKRCTRAKQGDSLDVLANDIYKLIIKLNKVAKANNGTKIQASMPPYAALIKQSDVQVHKEIFTNLYVDYMNYLDQGVKPWDMTRLSIKVPAAGLKRLPWYYLNMLLPSR